jgi:putative ABC transport system permease protein
VVVTRLSQALEYTNNGRNTLSFVLARSADDADRDAVAAAVAAATGQRVLTRDAFERASRDYVIGNTGIPVSIGTTVALGILVGIAIVALTFSIFVAENRREFGALRAMGVGDGQLIGMIAMQAVVVGILGYLLGLGVAAAFFLFAAGNVPAFRGFYLPWEVAVLTAALVVAIMAIAAGLSLRRVLAIDPAIVFRG